jgi:hypothetical protein
MLLSLHGGSLKARLCAGRSFKYKTGYWFAIYVRERLNQVFDDAEIILQLT